MIARPHSLTDLAIKPLPATISLILAPDPVIQSLYTQWPRAKVTWRYGRPLHSDPHSTSGFIDVLFTDDRRLEVEPRTSTDNPRQREWLVWALDDRGELLSYAYTPPLLAASSSEDHASAIAKCARRCFANAALDDIRLAASDQAFRDPQRILMALRSFFAGIPEEPNSLNCVEGFLSFMEAARSLLPLDLNVDPRGHMILQEEFTAFVEEAHLSGFEVLDPAVSLSS